MKNDAEFSIIYIIVEFNMSVCFADSGVEPNVMLHV